MTPGFPNRHRGHADAEQAPPGRKNPRRIFPHRRIFQRQRPDVHVIPADAAKRDAAEFAAVPARALAKTRTNPILYGWVGVFHTAERMACA